MYFCKTKTATMGKNIAWILLFISLELEICSGAACGNTFRGENDPSNKAHRIESNSAASYLMSDSDYMFDCCGVVDRWRVYVDNVASTRTLDLQVWRPTGSGDNYELVGENTLTVTSDGDKTLNVATGDQITVKNNDKFGWWTSGSDLVMYKTGGNEDDDNWLLTTGDNNEGDTQDWSGKTDHNDRSYAIRADVIANSDPSFTNLPSSTSITNNFGSGVSLYTVSVTDSNPDDVSTLTVSMTSNSQFSFDTSTLILTTSTLSGAASTEQLVFRVVDQCSNTGTATYTVTITNEPLTIHSLPASNSISEDVTVETSLHAINVTDPGDSVTCSKASSVPAAWPFLVKSNNVIYSSASPGFDYNTKNQYVIAIDCEDGVNTVSNTFTVDLIQNTPPVIQNLQNATSVSTTSSIGAVAFTVISTDAEGDSLTYSMTCSPTPCPFQIFSSGNILVNEDLSNHTTVGYEVYVTVADARGSDGPDTLTITITDINDPVILSNIPLGSSLSVTENTALATSVYTVSYSDVDASQTHVFSMTSTPSVGMAYFNIDPSSGLITTSGTVLNYELLGITLCTFSVTVSDGVASDTERLVIDIVNENEAPVFSPTSYSLNGNESTSGSTVGTPVFGITDPDSGDSYTLTMDCGASSSYFIMISTSGEVRFQSDYDVDSGSLPSSVTCVVTATDNGGLQDDASLIINIANINDHTPAFVPTTYIFYMSYYAAAGTILGATTATDADSGAYGTLAYTLNQASLSGQYFTINSSGTVLVQQSAQGTSPLNYTSTAVITVIATDGGGLADTATVTIVVSDTTSTSSTTTTEAYKTFIDDPMNWAWLVPCSIILMVTMTVFCWTALTCHGEKGCDAFIRKWRSRNGFKTRPNGNRQSNGRNRFFPRDGGRAFDVVDAQAGARNAPPPIELQSWRRQVV